MFHYKSHMVFLQPEFKMCIRDSSSYSRLQEALADIRVIYDETVSQLQALQAQLPICVEAEDGQEEA